MKPRIVINTNVYVSRLLRADSSAGKAVELAWRSSITLMSESTLDELRHVLYRPKFKRYLKQESIEPYLALVWEIAVAVEVPTPIRACRDPRDDQLLEVAVYGETSAILTGDDDLLSLHPFHGIAILTPSNFLLQHS